MFHTRHLKVARFVALRFSQLYPQRISLELISLQSVSTLDHGAAGRIKSIKNPNEPIGELNPLPPPYSL
jgi:hypothetical protein